MPYDFTAGKAYHFLFIIAMNAETKETFTIVTFLAQTLTV